MPRTVDGGRFITAGLITLENAAFRVGAATLLFGTVIYVQGQEIDLVMI